MPQLDMNIAKPVSVVNARKTITESGYSPQTDAGPDSILALVFNTTALLKTSLQFSTQVVC